MGDLVGGRFEIEAEAGAGAMSRVYRARDTTNGDVVAVKVLNGATEHVLRRFTREAPDVAAALATGVAVLSGPTPMGAVIDRAAGELSGAMGQIRIDRETAGLIEGRFELATEERGALLVGERVGELDPMHTLLGKPTRWVGRDRELATIEAYFAEVIGESTARAVIVIAEPGIGKSRLAHEVQRRLASHSEAPHVIVARCESISERSPFACAAAAVRRAAAIEPADPPALRAERLATLLARDGAADPDVVEFLGEMLNIPSDQPSERLIAARENPALAVARSSGGATAAMSRAAR